MFPKITDLLNYLFGINLPLPIQTFGFFVAIGFAIANYYFVKEMKRKEAEGLVFPNVVKTLIGEKASISELLLNAVIGFFIGYKILYAVFNYSDFVRSPQEVLLTSKGNLLAGIIVALIAVYLKYSEKQKALLAEPVWKETVIRPHEHVATMTVIAAVSGLIGAKIFHNLENPDEFMADPVGAMLSFSGLTMYGGLIVGSTSVLLYARKHNLDIKHVIDSCAPGLFLAYGIGRLGCHMSGDGDWGINNLAPKPSWMSALPDWIWSFRFPHNVISEGVPIPGCVGDHCYQLPYPVYPTSFYEFLMSVVIFFILWSIRKKIKVPGQLFAIYLMFNGFERFWIEKIRVNTLYHIAGYGITQAEIISTILFFLGIIYFIYLQKKYGKKVIA